MAEPTELLASLPEDPAAAAEVLNSVKVSLADLCAKGTAQYARKNYDEAADLYARASELQAELNGEMSPENAEILFLYGRSLFKVGQSKSDVLGGRAGGEKKKPSAASKAKKEDTKDAIKDEADSVAEGGVASIAGQAGGAAKPGPTNGNKALFQFTGDENFEDSDDDEVGDEGEGEEEEEDDLAAAFEVLDLARVLFSKKLEQPEEGEGKGKEVGDSSATRHTKERLADTHDLLAEISLENERFPAAVTDFRSSLAVNQSLFSESHEAIAEAHYKLSLALEFASITRTKEDEADSKETEDETNFDQSMRDEAVAEMEAAIGSVRLKLQDREVELASSLSPDDNDVTIAQITDAKEIISEMEQRLVDLKAPPADSIKDALYGPTSGGNPLGGILGSSLGESPADATARIEEVTKNANDLSGLVRHKKKPKVSETGAAEPGEGADSTNGKRKAEDVTEDSGSSKKAKVEDAPAE